MTAARRTDDLAAAPSERRLAPLAAWLVFVLAWIGACGTAAHAPQLSEVGESPGTAAGCSVGSTGCACPNEGASAACGRVESQSGNYVTCSLGHSTCTGGSWGPCAGDHLVTRSRADVALTSGGIQVLSKPIACPNACDPNGCMATASSPDDVDASGFASSPDGGLSLQDATIPLDAGCVGLGCDVAACAGNVTTTLSGTVYDPAGNNPLFGAYVYIPSDPAAALPPYTTGASCDTCSGAAALLAIQATETDAAGNFTLANVPTLPNLPVVVQLGKWRREIVLETITSCHSNTIAGNCTAPNPADCVFRLPRNQTDGYDPVAATYSKADLPRIAIVTGKSDPFDCLLLKAGVDPHEFGDYMSNKRMHFYRADGAGGGDSLDPAYGMNVAGSTLWNTLSGPAHAMTSYDAILLPCEGGANDHQTGGNTAYQNLVTYVDSGGRAFTTHFGYSWLAYPASKGYVPAPDNWSSLADWSPTGPARTSTVDTQDPLTGVVDTSFPKGAVYSQWLQNLGATNVPTQLAIHEGRQDLTTVGKDVQTWMTANDRSYTTAPDYTNLFTFNTPLGAAGNAQCGRVVYSDFHVSASAQVGATNQCIANVDCGFSATCQGSTGGADGQCHEPCGTSADCPNGSFACAGSAIGSCDPPACSTNGDCAAGHACVKGVCECNANSECYGSCAAMTCSPVACTRSGQCGNGTCGGGTCPQTVPCHATTDCGLGTCGGSLHAGSCSAGAACHENVDCGAGTCGTGPGATAGTCATSGQTCGTNADCDSHACVGGTCTTASCHIDTDCAVDGSTCHGATCTAAACDGDADCPTGATCLGATCTPPAACAVNADCGTAGSAQCTGTVCSANACTSSADCGPGSLCGGTCVAPACTQNSDCASGACHGGTCGCVSGENCGSLQTCDGAVSGTCARTCTQNSDCAPDLCVNGQCGGCSNSSQCHDSGFETSCLGIPPGNYGQCAPFGATEFPEACRQGALSSQEKALEFMFFDLTSCVSPDNALPPPPPISITGYPPATFTVDYQATSCPPQTLPIWRELDWQAQIPPGASIVFSAQSGPDAATLLPAAPLLLDTATTDTPVGPTMSSFDVALIDAGPKGMGAFNLAMPPVASGNLLRVTITLNPTPDYQQTPTLDQWRVQYDCGASE